MLMLSQIACLLIFLGHQLKLILVADNVINTYNDLPLASLIPRPPPGGVGSWNETITCSTEGDRRVGGAWQQGYQPVPVFV